MKIVSSITINDDELNDLLKKCDLVMTAYRKKRERGHCLEYDLAKALRDILDPQPPER